MTRVRFEPRSGDQGRRKNDTFILSATLPCHLNLPTCNILKNVSHLLRFQAHLLHQKRVFHRSWICFLQCLQFYEVSLVVHLPKLQKFTNCYALKGGMENLTDIDSAKS